MIRREWFNSGLKEGEGKAGSYWRAQAAIFLREALHQNVKDEASLTDPVLAEEASTKCNSGEGGKEACLCQLRKET